MARPWALPPAPGEACEKAEVSVHTCAQGWSRVLRKSPGWMTGWTDTQTSTLESPTAHCGPAFTVTPGVLGHAGPGGSWRLHRPVQPPAAC